MWIYLHRRFRHQRVATWAARDIAQGNVAAQVYATRRGHYGIRYQAGEER